ncbi:MAG: sigma-70 family RNA polymerase sigma factor [Bacteroidales bacterium]|nr:sigma-70 family RNA polymerase sigma factor [Bacteroidales bacterium]
MADSQVHKPSAEAVPTAEKPVLKLTEMTDAQLVELALAQNQAAYIVLYTRYNKGVRGHIARYISQKEDIEDICLESFSKAFSQIASYNPEYRFSTWLYRIARNTAFDHISRKDREKNNLPTTSISDQNSDADEIPYPVANPEDSIISRQEYDKLVANIDRLKEDYRVVAKMNLIDNFGYREIAEALDVPINTVKTRIRRAKAQLLKMVNTSDEIQ